MNERGAPGSQPGDGPKERFRPAEGLAGELVKQGLIRELTHVRARCRAFRLEVESWEREIRTSRDPRAEPLLAALAAVRETLKPVDPAGSTFVTELTLRPEDRGR